MFVGNDTGIVGSALQQGHRLRKPLKFPFKSTNLCLNLPQRNRKVTWVCPMGCTTGEELSTRCQWHFTETRFKKPFLVAPCMYGPGIYVYIRVYHPYQRGYTGIQASIITWACIPQCRSCSMACPASPQTPHVGLSPG